MRVNECCCVMCGVCSAVRLGECVGRCCWLLSSAIRTLPADLPGNAAICTQPQAITQGRRAASAWPSLVDRSRAAIASSAAGVDRQIDPLDVASALMPPGLGSSLHRSSAAARSQRDTHDATCLFVASIQSIGLLSGRRQQPWNDRTIPARCIGSEESVAACVASSIIAQPTHSTHDPTPLTLASHLLPHAIPHPTGRQAGTTKRTVSKKMSAAMDAGKRLLSLVFFLLFVLGTVVQLNDPDPEVCVLEWRPVRCVGL